MKYCRINSLTNCAKYYGNFLNDYEPYSEYYKFADIGQPFDGFSTQPIIFERDTSYENKEPISDFLLNDWAEIIVSERIYKMLKDKYSDEIDFYTCFARDEGQLKPYYILRPKYEIDVLDRENSTMIDYGIVKIAFKTILKDDIEKKYNYFVIKDGASNNIISKQLYDDLKALNPTNFEVTPIATTSEELKARERKKKLKNQHLMSSVTSREKLKQKS